MVPDVDTVLELDSEDADSEDTAMELASDVEDVELLDVSVPVDSLDPTESTMDALIPTTLALSHAGTFATHFGDATGVFANPDTETFISPLSTADTNPFTMTFALPFTLPNDAKF
jgi:hypothetical protein